MDLFTLVARLGMDSSEYEREITKARGSFQQLGGFISAKAVAFGTMAAHAIEKASSAALNFGKSSIQAAADLEAERELFKQVFGTMQGEAEKSFDAVGKSTGILASRLKSVGTKAFMQFKGAGLDGVGALEMMEQYTSLAADAAAAYNISLEDADARLRSFLRGNTEAGDAIGLFTTESQRNTAAIDKYGKKWKDLNEAQRQMLMLDVSKDIYKQGEVLGQAGRESEQFNVKLDNLRKAWETAQGIFGDPIKATLTPYLQDITDFLEGEGVKLKLEQYGLAVSDAISDSVQWVMNPTFPTWDEVKAEGQAAFDAINAGLETAVDWSLGKLGMPPADTIVADVKSWWTGQGENAYERVKAVLTWSFGEWVAPAASDYTDDVQTWWESTFMPSLTSITQWTFGELVAPAWVDMYQGVYSWWNNSIRPAIKRVASWDIGKVNWPSLSTMVSSASAWWSSVKGTISSIFTIAISPTYSKPVPQSAVDAAMQKYSAEVDAITGASSRAVGLDYVPYNDFYARLHEGEAILTKEEANKWRSGGETVLQIDYDRLGLAIAKATSGSQKVFTPDGRVLGDIVTERVSQNIAFGAQSKRYR